MRSRCPLVFALIVPLFFPAGCTEADDPRTSSSVTDDAADEATALLLARADSFELDTEYQPPPGDALAHHAAGFAKILCSNVFIAGLAPDFVAENVGFFSSPYDERRHVTDTVVDFEREAVHLTLPSGVTRTAKRYGSQGCVALPIGEDSVRFAPVVVEPDLPDPATTPWPMGDVLSDDPLPSEVDTAMVRAAVDAAFEPSEGMTAAFVVTHRGRIIGERYGEGVDLHTPLESWSMGKSLTGALMGVLIQQGEYELWQPAPIPEWQEPGDPRQEIRIGDLMRMSSGLRFRAPQDPDYDPDLGYPDHLYVYNGTTNTFEWTAGRPPQWPPNVIGRYRNSDPVLVNYLIRLAVEGRGESYLEFPQRHLFDRLGIRNILPEVDPYGNFLLQGYDMASARDWARLGNLFLQDGVWNGERILPEGYAEYANTVAPAWEADGRPVYGGAFFWVNRTGARAVPEDAYRMTGAGGQTAIVVPSHDLVVVRLGHFRGSGPGMQALDRALELLTTAVPESARD